MKLVWDETAWDDYVWWQTQDRKTPKRINTLIKDVQRSGNERIGKPELLKLRLLVAADHRRTTYPTFFGGYSRTGISHTSNNYGGSNGGTLRSRATI